MFSKNCFNKPVISEFVESLKDVELAKTDLHPDEKKIHLSDHHGQKELSDFCKKIKRSCYVTEIQSTHWGGSDFIRKIYKDGPIEMVLTKTKRKYALRVETKEIARLLEEEYGNKQ